MLPELTQRLLAQWANLPIDRRCPNQLRFLGIRTGLHDDYALFLAFADSDNVPFGMVKIARESIAATYLQREWNILNHFQKHGLNVPGVSLPRSIFSEVVNGVRIVVTTAPMGQSMIASNLPDRDLTKVADRLAKFACATRTVQPTWMVRQELENSFEQLGNTFDRLSDREMKVIEGWITQKREMTGSVHTEVIAAHGNLHRQNVWLERDQLTIINWEHGEQTSFPLFDLFTLTTTYQLSLERRGSLGSYLDKFRRMYLCDGPLADLIGQSIFSYCQILDLHPESVLAHFGIFLARAALKEYAQLTAAAKRGYLPLLDDPNLAQQEAYQGAIKNQLWINLLRMLIKERSYFQPTAYGRLRNTSQFIAADPSTISTEQL